MVSLWLLCFAVLRLFTVGRGQRVELDPAKCVVWGPGLSPDTIVMPARYFYIHAVERNNTRLEDSPGDVFEVTMSGISNGRSCRVWVNTLDRKDGSFIIRYRIYDTCHKYEIQIKYHGKHVASSPYKIAGPVYAEDCSCPVKPFTKWTDQFGCPSNYSQIISDLQPFPVVNFTAIRDGAIKSFNHPESMSVCNYVVKNNQVYRKCYGRYIGFKMFMDAILLSLARKVYLPDMELFVNLGDWPLTNVQQGPHYPMFSWCGSDDSVDIVMPTYDITEATLECMGRVMLDMLSVQGNIQKKWNDKVEKAFWRGRDSRRERLQLIDIARKNPDLFNASLTNFFFFRDQEAKYGPKEKHISFFKFFDYKYQINIDGTVAAYRFPYLLVGDSVILKQDSKYYEFFYNLLEPWKHYIPIKSDLSDLVEKLFWAKQNDGEAKHIALNGQKFARENLMPQHIFCYHAVLFKMWSERLVGEVSAEGMDHVPQPETKSCECHRSSHEKDTTADVSEEQGIPLTSTKDEL